jgi:hypothetical protein
VFAVWSSLHAVIWMCGVAHGLPTGSPFASQPSKLDRPGGLGADDRGGDRPLPPLLRAHELRAAR